ncbi:annulin isoform X1 [Neodiprion virginianus]|uniref:annulin isoform X1 n=1 Tax=Neodiprion virginianus TaxID=2961670 RepID=UPI001EE780CE|nr:annulin isoform X1 [Neodiprion virginianus]
MGHCFSVCSKFRAVFHLDREHLQLNPLCERPDCMPKPPSQAQFTPGGDSEVSILTVVNVDQCVLKNAEAHRTSRFELSRRKNDTARLIIRRGEPFYIKLILSRAYNPNTDAISLVFTLDGVEKPQYGHGTLVAAPVLKTESDSEGPWHAVEDYFDGNTLKLKIIPAADAKIGKWKMDVDTKWQDNSAISFTVNDPFYVIFNPWCEYDTVFLGDESARQEYVMADAGLIWRGSYNRQRPTVWKYSQFEKDVLECALYLVIETGKVRISGRHDPVIISRRLSSAINSPDDNGAVMGNWSNDFGGGTAPTKWMGSQKILQEYYTTKNPVKYGQCWVFSGVLTTVCRALGIPCRPVTNYSSAHDTQGSLTVDCFIDAEGKVMEEMNNDSIWNYHVWNEVWMSRPDLTPECGGWQAIDATPQELSEDAYRCGPASVAAVKKGEVMRPYDSRFVFAEVNADKVFWRYNGPVQPLKLIRTDMYGIGRSVCTKAVGKWERDDITNMYKYPEKSGEERAVMLKALQHSASLFSRYYLNEKFNDIKFDFELRDDIIIGEPFTVSLITKNNNSSQEYHVSVIICVEAVLYTGRIGNAIKRSETKHLIKPGVVEEINLSVSWEEYGPRLLDQCAFNITCLASVQEGNFEYFAQDDFRVRKPDIKIQVTEEPIIGGELHAIATFKNPLPIPLNRGRFLIEGPGLDKQLKLKLKDKVEVGEEASCMFSMTPRIEGRSTIAAKFHSDELEDVDGFINFMVNPAKPSANDVQ